MKKVHILRPGQPHLIMWATCDSPNVSVFCAVSKMKVYGPFFNVETTVSGMAHVDVLEQWLWP
jgi:hypothetical protein